jgi:hypothetical protein
LTPIALTVLLCGCRSPAKQHVDLPPLPPDVPVFRAASFSEDIQESPAAPVTFGITSLQPMPGVVPPNNFRAYSVNNGSVLWNINSNFCAAWKLGYKSNNSCWLWYGLRPDTNTVMKFSNTPGDWVYIGSYVRIGDALLPGENTVVVSLPMEESGFLTLRVNP